MKAVVVGASAGGVESLRPLLAGLPDDLDAPVFVVLHLSVTARTALPAILDRAGPLPAAAACDGEKIVPGRVYVAPPDHHLLVTRDQVRLSRGPRLNGVRPAVDALFKSAAEAFGPGVLAVVLSGALDDGAAGAATVERHGGRVIVQDPEEATHLGMPSAALAATRSAEALPVRLIAARIAEHYGTNQAPPTEQTRASAPEQARASAPEQARAQAPEQARAPSAGGDAGSAEPGGALKTLFRGDMVDARPNGEHTTLSCPDCGGPLYQTSAEPQAYTCRVGHAWGVQSLLEGQAGEVERALWVAIIRLQERSDLMTRMKDAAHGRGHGLSAARFEEAAREAREAARTIRTLIEGLSARPGQGEQAPG
ncbi:chemotaxis protein CheB [Bailinhaonella thermotolerans]|uniref:chemotaxis protein CheB n=1 Tax=Bailinhaonella thermotolerans TaxID=1070861 RepID=UPI00192A69BA|nr:chemotaxis protein CheB [Bailinhaonella thermotolerans]